jgi:hypothetical protein
MKVRLQFGLRTVFAVILVAGVVFGVASWPARERRQTELCRARLRQIAMAMRAYYDDFGTLPPAYIVDANGRPMHSWRVLLLPYLGHQQLYARYRFDEPWNGPNNRRLAGQTPAVFTCPADRGRDKTRTSYLVVTGEKTVFNGAEPMALDSVEAFTLLVVECADSGIDWMEPRDLRHDAMSMRINDRSGTTCVRSNHGRGANVALSDARAQFVSERVDPYY